MRKFEQYLDENTQSVGQGVEQLLKIAHQKLQSDPRMKEFYKNNKYGFVAKKLNKYTAIYNTRDGNVESIHAFVDNETGDLLKAAGFKKPAKGPRGNVTDKAFMKELEKRFDQYGGYLYKR